MDILVWAGFAVVVVAMLLLGGRALRFNLRLRMRPFQPKYGDESDATKRDSR